MKQERKKLLRLAAMVIPAGLFIATYALAGGRSNCWMTGGGSIFAVEYGGEDRITHGFVVHCDPRKSDNLEVNDHGTGWHFHMDNLTSAICIDDPAISPNPPDASFDTFIGEGTGICRNVGGEARSCTVQFVFTDGGERGGCIRDAAVVNVEDNNGNLLISVSGDVDCGNHQAHSK